MYEQQQKSMLAATEDLNPTKEEIKVFNEWYINIINNTGNFPGCSWRNVLRDIRGNLFKAFLIRYRASPVMQFQKK